MWRLEERKKSDGEVGERSKGGRETQVLIF